MAGDRRAQNDRDRLHQRLGNYAVAVLDAAEAGEIPMTPGLHHVHVYHDDWCGIYKGRPCNCEPVIRAGGETIGANKTTPAAR